MPSCSLETNQVLKVKYCHYIQACVVSVSDRVIARTLTEKNSKLEEGGGGVSFLPLPSLLFDFFSSRSNFLDKLAQKRTHANPILAVCTSNGR